MLFDLRSRGRRRTVQVIYLFLALIMLGGLLLVGVGTGSGGGILNAFTNNGSGNNQNAVVSGQVKKALQATQATPTSPAAWDQLIQFRSAAAQQPPDVTSTGVLTAAGKRQLQAIAQDWQHYLTLTKTPDSGTAILAAHAYEALGNFSGESTAWETWAAQNPNIPKGFECMAAAAYASGDARKAQLAAQQAEQVTPKAGRPQTTLSMNSAKASKSAAEQQLATLQC
jgi:hypothetical protein